MVVHRMSGTCTGTRQKVGSDSRLQRQAGICISGRMKAAVALQNKKGSSWYQQMVVVVVVVVSPSSSMV